MNKAQQLDDTLSKPAATGTGLTRRERQRRRCLRSLLLVAATILCINAAVTSLLISWRTPVVVSFDMKKTLDQFTEQAGSRSLDESQTKALTERFMTSLNAELQDWQRRHDALILVTPAVVSGVDDITNEIQTGVAHRMAAGGDNG
ncbi:type-F conjugative transfer system protein TrbI [Cronobacter sakazakii]|nr:type-F conjugative transfer system protein TrbI [Cronobacter sakazakii]ELY5804657.1 type-F conjugative transfer system protein TrbI [Cronobacter sakazakii]ELY5855244.1 type-F conjugative transfer system protein TrbI [Cronobacter malonaticus]HAY0260897.1 type-F conjugative transfer system protein TrbI [Escherichia coli]